MLRLVETTWPRVQTIFVGFAETARFEVFSVLEH